MQIDLERYADEVNSGLNDVFESFGFYSVPDLTEAEKQPPEFLIEGMLPCGMTILSGAPKTRKSFFALQIAIAVASGQSFFGRKTTQCDVVYLDLEGTKGRISTRAAQMSIPIPRNVYITNRVKEKLADGLVDKLQELHRQRPNIRLIIIDTYAKAKGERSRGSSANAYEQDVTFLDPIQRMAQDENIAILLVTHDKKGASLMSDSFERVSGTMGITGSADCVMNLITVGKRFEGRATLDITPRDAAGCEMKIIFDNCYGEWQEISDPSVDLLSNPLCSWIAANKPEPRKEGQFFSYDDVYSAVYKTWTEKPGDTIREQIVQNRNELFSSFGVGVQIGVQSHGKRGIRLINLK